MSNGQRVGAFIDVQNLYYAAKHKYQGRVDYGELLKFIASDRQLISATAYAVQKPQINQQEFFDVLSKHGYRLRVKEAKVRNDESGQSSTRASNNVEMALEAMQSSSKLDVVALVTGDGDMAALVRTLQAYGCLVEVYAVEGSMASELKNLADYWVALPPNIIQPSRREIPASATATVAVPAQASRVDYDEQQPVNNSSRPLFEKPPAPRK